MKLVKKRIRTGSTIAGATPISLVCSVLSTYHSLFYNVSLFLPLCRVRFEVSSHSPRPFHSFSFSDEPQVVTVYKQTHGHLRQQRDPQAVRQRHQQKTFQPEKIYRLGLFIHLFRNETVQRDNILCKFRFIFELKANWKGRQTAHQPGKMTEQKSGCETVCLRRQLTLYTPTDTNEDYHGVQQNRRRIPRMRVSLLSGSLLVETFINDFASSQCFFERGGKHVPASEKNNFVFLFQYSLSSTEW